MYVIKVLFHTIPKLARVFAERSFISELLLILQFWYFALTRKMLFRGKSMKFTLRYLGNYFDLYIESVVDLAVLDEVFIQEEYSWVLPSVPKVIIDLGAHFGDTALYYHFKYPEAQILALEPAPATFKRLCENVRSYSNIIPIHAGVSNVDGYADLHVSASSIGSSFNSRLGTIEVISVPVFTLRSVLEKHDLPKADLIKFDIEGAEQMLFAKDAPETLSGAYIGEVHGDLMSMSIEDFMARFKEFDIQTESMKNKKRMIIKCLQNQDENFLSIQ